MKRTASPQVSAIRSGKIQVREPSQGSSFLGIPRLILAYRTGTMRYGIFTLSKVGEDGR